MNTRTIPVTKEFYAQLAEYLQPEERWVDGVVGRPNLILYSTAGAMYPATKLVFFPVVVDEVEVNKQ